MKNKFWVVVLVGCCLAGCGSEKENISDNITTPEEVLADEMVLAEKEYYTYEKELVDENNRKYNKKCVMTLEDEEKAKYEIIYQYSEAYFITTTYLGAYTKDEENIVFIFDDPQDGLAASEIVYNLKNGQVVEVTGEEPVETVTIGANKLKVTISDTQTTLADEEPYIPYEPNFEAYGEMGRLQFQINDDGTAMTQLTLNHEEVRFTGKYTVDGKTQRVCAVALTADNGMTCNMNISYNDTEYKYYYTGEIK